MSINDQINESDRSCDRIDDIGSVKDTLMSIIEALKEIDSEIQALKKAKIDP